eukprot:scaffold24698_cov63-Phaeocystis_antarctica.AAC.3
MEAEDVGMLLQHFLLRPRADQLGDSVAELIWMHGRLASQVGDESGDVLCLLRHLEMSDRANPVPRAPRWRGCNNGTVVAGVLTE